MPSKRPLAWIGIVVLVAAAAAHNAPRLSPGMFNWAEPGNVGAALAGGRGFSDPFDGGTGATAWVSPLPAALDAFVFLALGTKTPSSAAALLALAVIGLAASNCLLESALRPHGRWLACASCAAFLAYCSLVPGGPLEVQSEAWLDILLSVLLLWSAVRWAGGAGGGASVALVACGLLAPLESAGLAVAGAGASALLLWRARGDARRRAVPAAALAAAVLAAAAWGARNEAALGRFIPLKSNFWFELNLANVDAPDGLPRMENVLRRLPFFDVAEFERYSRLGEVRYVDSFRRPALAALRADPAHFVGNVLRRSEDALVFCRRDGGGEPTGFHFAVGDWARLVTAGELISTGPTTGLWARIDAPPYAEEKRIRGLGLSDPAGVIRDWESKRLAYDDRNFGPGGIVLGYLTAGVPAAALAIAALLLGRALPEPAAWAAAIACSMLLPFVLVNHNERHQLPLIAMQSVAIGALAHALALRLRAHPSP